MSTEIVKNDEWLSKQEKAIIRKQFFPPSATDLDMQYCMSVAKTFNLNPILKQIYFIERRSYINNNWVIKIEPLAGRDSFLTLAHRTGRFDGLKSETMVKKIPKLSNNGDWVEVPELVAVATVWVKDSDRQYEVEVSYSEYVQRKKDGSLTKFWLEKPHTMLKKVAESQVLRKAFDITGLYDESEIGNNHEKKQTKIAKSDIKPELGFAKQTDELKATDDPLEKIEVEVLEVTDENGDTGNWSEESDLKEMKGSLDEQ